MTRLRTMMLEELQRRNYSQHTARAYVRVVCELAAYFRQPPDRLGPEHMRLFQSHLFRERKLNARTVVQYSAALRFFFVKTLKASGDSAGTSVITHIVHRGVIHDDRLVVHVRNVPNVVD